MGRKEGRILLTKDVNKSEDGEDGDEAEPGEGIVGIGVCGDRNWGGGVVVVTAGCSSETDAAKGAVGVVL